MATSTVPSIRMVFDVTGMDCADCAHTVEVAVSRLPGIATADVSLGSATLVVTLPEPQSDALTGRIERAVADAGYRAAPRVSGARATQPHLPWHRDRRVRRSLLGGILWALGMVSGQTAAPGLAATLAFVAAIFVAGRTPGRAALIALRNRRMDMNVLMTIAVLGAAALGEWSEGAITVVLFSLGTGLQALTLDRTRGTIASLLDLTPPTALRLTPAGEESIAAVDLALGDRILIRPGDRIPIDGLVLEGTSSVDQAALTGEPLPVDRTVGDTVLAGTLNRSGALVVEVAATAEDTTLARVIHLVEEAQGSRAPSQLLIDRFAAIYTPIVVVVAALIAVAGFVVGDPRAWVERALVLIVIACPCSLVISTPVSIVAGIGTAARRGILIKGGAALEAAGTIRVAAFDKTGTLTHGRPVVTAVNPESGIEADALLAIAAATDLRSEHPIAAAIVAAARERGLQLAEPANFVAQPGQGATADIDNGVVAVGSVAWIAGLTGQPVPQPAPGQTLVGVASLSTPPRLLGTIALADTVRPESAEAIGALHRIGVRTAILSGDHPAAAAPVAVAIGIDDVRAGLLPDQKATELAALRAAHGPIAMIGDGINDAPALATADVGIAMGRGGSALAVETADIALLNDDPRLVAVAIQLARQATGIIRQNIGVSLAVKAIVLALGAAGLVNLWGAVASDMGTSLLVTFNALRLLRHRPDREPPPA